MIFGTELISLIAGSFTGFLFKFAAEKRKENAHILEIALKAKKAESEFYDRAVKRVPLDAGKIVRRFIVGSVFFAIVFGPFLLSLTGVPVVVQTTEQYGGWLFGLIPRWTDTVFTNIQGFVLLPEVRHLLPAIGGFYLGQGSAK